MPATLERCASFLTVLLGGVAVSAILAERFVVAAFAGLSIALVGAAKCFVSWSRERPWDLERFWAAYPEKGDAGAAKNAFARYREHQLNAFSMRHAEETRTLQGGDRG